VRQALLRAWNSFWFRPAGPTGLLAARSIVCAQALWILLSRPNLPEILDWPHAFWLGVDRALAGRFLILGLPTGIERALYWLLLAGLAAGVLGFFSRATGLAMALLLYHFAAFEDIFSSRGGPFFRGLTVPVVALVLLACAEMPRWRARPSPEFRWPLTAIQILFAFTYLFSGISKLLAMGPRWFSARNFQGLVLGLIIPEVSPPWSRAVAASTALCQAGAVAAFALDFLLVLAAFSPRAARFAIPALALGHLLVVKILGVVFLGLPLLLIFVDWDAIAGQIERRRSAGGLRKAEGILSAPQAGPELPRSLRR
jgi:hypothetical protein